MLTTIIGATVGAAQKAVQASIKKNKSSSSGSAQRQNQDGAQIGYDAGVDYAAAIAKTTDIGERARLLTARQAKMDALGLNGKTSSNEALMQSLGASSGNWMIGSGYGSQLNVGELYDVAARTRLQAFETARRNIQKNLQTQYADIDRVYQQGMTQVDVNARRSALANEEKLAALGLNMGGNHEAATSGYTETSRIAVDNAYRSDLNALAQERTGAYSAAAQSATGQLDSLLGQYYNREADASLAKAQSRMKELSDARDYSISVAGLTGYLNGIPTLSYQKAQNDMQASTEQTAYERALGRWKTYGYVLPADAALLGVAAGTPTSDQSYRAAQLQLNQIKTNYQVSK